MASKPKLPQAVERKLYKTGQTRGASPADVYQNRVGRNSTVLVPFSHWKECRLEAGAEYENGAICLIAPQDYFEEPDRLREAGLTLGHDALVFYSTQADWARWPPVDMGWTEANSRIAPLGGAYVARVPGTTSADLPPIRHGFTTTALRGAGIRVYEYASTATIRQVRLQLELLIWMCSDSGETFEAAGLSHGDVERRRKEVDREAKADGLLDLDRLQAARAINAAGRTVCPLCLEELSAHLFSDRIKQAAGRERIDSTITTASMFHIQELRVGELGHRPYNAAWGHHYCNVVTTDVGIASTLKWMRSVIARNDYP